MLDTNVLSEALRQQPDPSVRDWLDRQDEHRLFITAITAAELLAGVAQLPPGRRRSGLGQQVAAILHDFGERRILPFDIAAAHAFADLRARARAAGLAMGALDAQIAAIATAHGGSVASRDTAPFIAAGVPVIDPWRSPAA